MRRTQAYGYLVKTLGRPPTESEITAHADIMQTLERGLEDTRKRFPEYFAESEAWPSDEPLENPDILRKLIGGEK